MHLYIHEFKLLQCNADVIFLLVYYKHMYEDILLNYTVFLILCKLTISNNYTIQWENYIFFIILYVIIKLNNNIYIYIYIYIYT